MDKKTFLWISLFFSLLSLFYYAMSYYGMIRYFSLQRSSTTSFIENYKSLPRAEKGRVVISVSATVDEICKLKGTINSLLDQSVKVDEILLFTKYTNIPKIPAELKPVLTVNGYSKNYSASPNILCGLLTEPDAKTKIILVEPNVIYGEEFVEKLVGESMRKPDSLIKTKYGTLIKPSLIKKDVSSYEDGNRCILESNLSKAEVSYNFSYKY